MVHVQQEQIKNVKNVIKIHVRHVMNLILTLQLNLVQIQIQIQTIVKHIQMRIHVEDVILDIIQMEINVKRLIQITVQMPHFKIIQKLVMFVKEIEYQVVMEKLVIQLIKVLVIVLNILLEEFVLNVIVDIHYY